MLLLTEMFVEHFLTHFVCYKLMNDVFTICIEKFFHHIFHKFYTICKTQSFAFAIELLKHWVTLGIATIGIKKSS